LNASPAEDLPKRLGQYEVLKRLAQGGMGEVLLAQREGADGFTRRVVIKRVLPHFGADASFMTMFRDEARITGQLHHGNITQVLEFGEAEGNYFLVLEFVDGPSLGLLLDSLNDRNERLSVPEIAHIGSETARALDYAHHKRGAQGEPLQIVHRDVSPSNVLLSLEGEVKLTDFGIARARARLSPKTQGTGVVKGKLAYLPPEALNGKSEPRSDLFALGAVLFEMLTGRPAFAAETEIETIHNVVINDIPRASDHVADVPAEIDDLVARLMSRTLSERPARGLEIVEVLTRFTMAKGRPANETLAETLASLGCVSPAAPDREVETEVPSASELQPRPPKVLVVDESRTMRALLRTILGAHYDVVEASSGEEALRVLEAAGVRAVVCQGTIQGSSGTELWKEIGSQPLWRGLPLILLAAEVNPKLQAAVRAAGAFALLPKRLDSSALLDTLRAAIGPDAERKMG
jgi:serine/threonine-protein kinase